MLLWLLPPLKQYKGGLFYYFLILAITDPLAFIATRFIQIQWNSSYMFFYFLQSISILYYSKKLNLRWILLCSVILFLTYYLLQPYSMTFPLILLHLIIVYHLFSIFLNDLFITNKINIYYPIILLYEFTILLKCSALIYSFGVGVYYFIFITAIEIVFCLYFIFYNAENSSKFKLGRI